MSAANINQTLADALGVQLQGTSTIGFTLRVRAGRLPLLTVHRHIFDSSQITPMTERLELRPVDETQAEPLDLDAMAEQARRRVAYYIEQLHREQVTRVSMVDSLWHMGLTWEKAASMVDTARCAQGHRAC